MPGNRARLRAGEGRVATISEIREGPDSGGGAPKADACLSLLFARGHRPDNAALDRALLAAGTGRISHSPKLRDRPETEIAWAEIIASGLTFDAIGLAPGRAVANPQPRHWRGAGEPDEAATESVGIAPGPHLAGAGHLLPVIKAQFGVAAALLAHCPGAVGAVWVPAELGIAAQPFVGLIHHWLDGGPFPAPALVGITEEESGVFVTNGLAFFLGSEIRLRKALAADALEARRLLFRLADRFIEEGGASQDEVLRLQDGSRLRVVHLGGELVVDRG